MRIVGIMDEAHHMCSQLGYEPVSTEKDLEVFLQKIRIGKGLRSTSGTSAYAWWLKEDARVGQAFSNCLEYEDQNRLEGTLVDPYHSDDIRDVLIALDYLLFSKE